jgi:predicted O-methyltransferase YrrM
MSVETVELARKALEFGAVQVPEEITAFVDFLKTRQLKNVMEIGSEAGGTFYLWCRLTALGGLKISLDLPSGDSGSGRFRDKAALAARTAQFKCWSANVHVVTGDSHQQSVWREVESILGGNQLDFLFIDGDHSCEGVKMDFEDYRCFVRPGGLIAFHDINDSEFHRRQGCFVEKFWRELQGEKQEFNAHQEWGGIGVLTTV